MTGHIIGKSKKAEEKQHTVVTTSMDLLGAIVLLCVQVTPHVPDVPMTKQTALTICERMLYKLYEYLRVLLAER